MLRRTEPRICQLARARGDWDDETVVVYVEPSVKWDDDWHVEVVLRATELQRVICGARRSSDGRPCQRAPSQGRKRCKFHGGMSPRGVDSPQHTGRGYSQDMPQRLAERFEQALLDPDLASLGAELALVDSRLGMLMGELEDASSPELWELAREGIAEALEHLPHEDGTARTRGLLRRTLDLLDRLDGEHQTWHMILKAVEQRRKLAEAERKREDQLEATMTAKQAMVFVAALKLALTEEIRDETLRARVGDRLAALLGKHTS